MQTTITQDKILKSFHRDRKKITTTTKTKIIDQRTVIRMISVLSILRERRVVKTLLLLSHHQKGPISRR